MMALLGQVQEMRPTLGRRRPTLARCRPSLGRVRADHNQTGVAWAKSESEAPCNSSACVAVPLQGCASQTPCEAEQAACVMGFKETRCTPLRRPAWPLAIRTATTRRSARPAPNGRRHQRRGHLGQRAPEAVLAHGLHHEFAPVGEGERHHSRRRRRRCLRQEVGLLEAVRVRPEALATQDPAYCDAAGPARSPGSGGTSKARMVHVPSTSVQDDAATRGPAQKHAKSSMWRGGPVFEAQNR